jgi:hypothetical protein
VACFPFPARLRKWAGQHRRGPSRLLGPARHSGRLNAAAQLGLSPAAAFPSLLSLTSGSRLSDASPSYRNRAGHELHHWTATESAIQGSPFPNWSRHHPI